MPDYFFSSVRYGSGGSSIGDREFGLETHESSITFGVGYDGSKRKAANDALIRMNRRQEAEAAAKSALSDRPAAPAPAPAAPVTVVVEAEESGPPWYSKIFKMPKSMNDLFMLGTIFLLVVGLAYGIKRTEILDKITDVLKGRKG